MVIPNAKKDSAINVRDMIRGSSNQKDTIKNTKFLKVSTTKNKLNLLNINDFVLPPIERNSKK
jgi:hypothetical protein